VRPPRDRRRPRRRPPRGLPAVLPVHLRRLILRQRPHGTTNLGTAPLAAHPLDPARRGRPGARRPPRARTGRPPVSPRPAGVLCQRHPGRGDTPARHRVMPVWLSE
jgi:hypothetical protein